MRIESLVSILLCLMLGIGSISAGERAGGESPVTSSERQFQEWLAAFNEGNQTALHEFSQKNRADQTVHLADDSRFREMTGGFEFKKTEENTPTKYVALLKEKDSDTFARITLQVEAAEPHRITNFQLRGMAPPAECRISPMTEHDAIAAARKVAEARTTSDQFSGAIAISKNGKVIFEQAYGLADRLKKIPTPAKIEVNPGRHKIEYV